MAYTFSWSGLGPSSQLSVTVNPYIGLSTGHGFSNATGHVTGFSINITTSYSENVGDPGSFTEHAIIEMDASTNGDFAEAYSEQTTTGS